MTDFAKICEDLEGRKAAETRGASSLQSIREKGVSHASTQLLGPGIHMPQCQSYHPEITLSTCPVWRECRRALSYVFSMGGGGQLLLFN